MSNRFGVTAGRLLHPPKTGPIALARRLRWVPRMYGEIAAHTCVSNVLQRVEQELSQKGAVLLRDGVHLLPRLSRLGSLDRTRPSDRPEGRNPSVFAPQDQQRPDLLILRCLRPARRDGETFIVDGTDVFRLLSARGRRQLKRVARDWHDGPRLQTQLPRLCPLQDTHLGPAVINGLLAMMPYRSIDPELGRRLAPELDRATLWEMMDATFEAAEEVDWSESDLLLVDNHRSMVGNAPYVDTRRTIEATMLWRGAEVCRFPDRRRAIQTRGLTARVAI